MPQFQYRVEMRVGHDMRVIDADSFTFDDQWMVFYHRPPEGGVREYWRVRMDVVASMETKRNSEWRT